MIRADVIEHLRSCGCIELRKDAKGYSVIRNVINGKMSGVPANDPLRAATVCRICKTLEVEIPEDARGAEYIVNLAHENHNNNH